MTPEERDAAVERMLDDAEAQGFPRKCTDPRVLGRVAAIIVDALDEAEPETKAS